MQVLAPRVWSSTSTLFMAATITLSVAAPSRAEQDGSWFGNGVNSEAVIATWPTSSDYYEIFVIGDDHKLWHIRANDTPLREPDWIQLDGNLELTGKPAVVTWDNDQIDVFARGLKDEALWHRLYDGKSWQPWTNLSGVLADDPVAIRRKEVDATLTDTKRWYLDVFVRGTDNELYLREFDGEQWTKFYSLGGSIAGTPKIVSWGKGRVDIFARSTDGSLLHSFSDPAYERDAWLPLTVIPGSEGLQTTDPEVLVQDENRIDIFTVQRDGALWQRSLRDGTWRPAVSLGGSLTSTPTIVSWEPGRFDAFARGSDGTLQNSYFITGWSKWRALGGNVGRRPSAIARGLNHVDLITVDEQHNIYRKRYDGSWPN